MSGVMHGGRLDDAVNRFGGKREKWIDLSTGINPFTYPIPEFSKRQWADLPDEVAEQSAMDAVRQAYGVDETAQISLAPGSQLHIQLLPYLFKPQPVAVVGFTYQEHGVCWRRAGHDVFVTDGLESAEATARIIIVVNPNNPDGRIYSRDELIGLSRRLGAKGGLLVVDESFGDVAPNSSVADEAGRDGLFVLRSLGKFYGLGGVRFGAGLGTRLTVERIDEMIGPWAVSGPALAIAADALSNSGWRKRMVKKLTDQREKLEQILIDNGLEIVGGTGLFVLARHGRAQELFEHLAHDHILTRSFPGKPEWLRFGLPSSKTALARLEKTLSGFAA